MNRLRLLSAVEYDIRKLEQFLAPRFPALAKKYRQTLFERFQWIVENPFASPIYDRQAGIRRNVFSKTVIFYRTDDHTVIVLGVFDDRQNVDALVFARKGKINEN